MANTRAATPQPPPLPGTTEILPLVIADLEARAAMGHQKYGTPLMAENSRDGLMDAFQESCDQTMYLRQAIVQQEALYAELRGLLAFASDGKANPRISLLVIERVLKRLLRERHQHE